MIHRTYQPVGRAAASSLGSRSANGSALIALGGAVFGLERLLALPTQPAISLFTLLVGGPAALMFSPSRAGPACCGSRATARGGSRAPAATARLARAAAARGPRAEPPRRRRGGRGRSRR